MTRAPARLLTDLADPAWSAPEPGTDDIFCPALHGFDPAHAATLAMLPVHDANGLLLDAVARAECWPAHGWACVFPLDPFRTAEALLAALARGGVARVCLFPVDGLMDDASLAMMQGMGLCAADSAAFAAECARQGITLGAFDPAVFRG